MTAICLIFGDTSMDGHNMHGSRHIDVNMSYKAFEQLLITSSNAFNFINSECRDYEDTKVSKNFRSYLEHINKWDELVATGFIYEDNGNYNYDYVDGYIDTFMWFLTLFNPVLEYKYIKDQTPVIDIGGYGLYS